MKGRLYPLALIGSLISSCGPSDGSPSLDHYSLELSDSIQSAQQSVAAHHDQVLAQSDLVRVRVLEQQHMTAMGTNVSHMRDAQGSMKTCEASFASTRDVQSLTRATSGMSQWMNDASAETAQHFQAMHDAADSDAARAEEDRHRTAMGPIFDHMQNSAADMMHAMQAMMDQGMSMMCSMHSHMHSLQL